MNIEHIFPGTELHVYKVTDILSEGQMKLLGKLVKGHLPTGYKQDELDQIVADIRSASVQACEEIFNLEGLTAKPENKDWPWFDVSADDDWNSRSFEHSGLKPGGNEFLSELFIQNAEGGEILFKRRLLPENSPKTPIKLEPGEMLIASREAHHEFEIKEITSGVRFTLLTHIH